MIAPTPLKETFRRLSLVWGVVPILAQKARDTDEMISKTMTLVCESGLAKKGQKVVITAGVPVFVKGTTNLIKAAEL